MANSSAFVLCLSGTGRSSIDLACSTRVMCVMYADYSTAPRPRVFRRGRPNPDPFDTSHPPSNRPEVTALHQRHHTGTPSTGQDSLTQVQGCVPGTNFAAKTLSLHTCFLARTRFPQPSLKSLVSDARYMAVFLDTTFSPSGVPHAPDAGRGPLSELN